MERQIYVIIFQKEFYTCNRVVSKMGFAAHFSTPPQTGLIGKMTENANNKIPEYAKNFKKEWLYITGINRKCGEFMKKLGDNTDSFEKVFWSPRARALIEHFKNVLEAQKMGKLQNISKLKFKLSAVYKIIDLRIDLYFLMGNSFYAEFFLDEDFQDFFENFIIFTNNVKIKNEEDFEDDLYLEYLNDNESESESDRDFRELFDRVFESESESDSDDDF